MHLIRLDTEKKIDTQKVGGGGGFLISLKHTLGEG